jgi:hypothetical protein
MSTSNVVACDGCGKPINGDFPDHLKAGKCICLDCQSEAFNAAARQVDAERERQASIEESLACQINGMRVTAEKRGDFFPPEWIPMTEAYRARLAERERTEPLWPWRRSGESLEKWITAGLAVQFALAMIAPYKMLIWSEAAWFCVVWPIIMNVTPSAWWKKDNGKERLMGWWYFGSIPFAWGIGIAYHIITNKPIQ